MTDIFLKGTTIDLTIPEESDLNTWYNLAIVVRGPTDMSLYLDGVELTNINYSGSGGSVAFTSSPFEIARYRSHWEIISGVGYQYKYCSVDNMTLWTKELTQSSIQYYMNNGFINVYPKNSYDRNDLINNGYSFFSKNCTKYIEQVENAFIESTKYLENYTDKKFVDKKGVAKHLANPHYHNEIFFKIINNAIEDIL